MSKFKTFLGKAGLILKKNSPDILVAAGAVGTVAAVVLACKATLKFEEIKAERQRQIDEIEKCREELPEKYSEKDVRSDTLKVDIHTGMKYVRTYAPAGIVLGVSLGLIFKSHGILKKRNAALGAAYIAIDSAFKKYRERVKEKYGDDVDRALKYGLKEEVLELKKDGVKEPQKEKILTADISKKYSGYARIFDEANPRWEKDSYYNFLFLRGAQAHFNDILNDKGHIFLNDVYDYLGFKKVPEGQVVGWFKNGKGDGYVDIGIFDMTDERKRAFCEGHERNIILDFNVDGPIMEML